MARVKTPIMRTSERKAFKRCQQRWWWEYREGLKAPGHRADNLWFGIGIHLALQERYRYRGLRRGTQVLKVWRDYVNDEVAYVRTLPTGTYVHDEDPVWVDARELGEAMLGAYLDTYGKDERWWVVATEREFAVNIPWPQISLTGIQGLSSREPLVTFMSRLDLVARDEQSDKGDMWIWDHKTAGQISTNYLPLDDQAGAYWALAHDALVAAKLMAPRQQLTGIMYNFLRKAKPDDRPRNADGLYTNKPKKEHYVAQLQASPTLTLHSLEELARKRGIVVLGEPSERQPPALFLREEVTRTRAERRTQIARLQNEALQQRFLRQHPDLIIKNPTRDCTYDCPFNALCELHESNDDYQEYKVTAFRRVDPYADYRPSAAE